LTKFNCRRFQLVSSLRRMVPTNCCNKDVDGNVAYGWDVRHHRPSSSSLSAYWTRRSVCPSYQYDLLIVHPSIRRVIGPLFQIDHHGPKKTMR
jgi:hypothetical protein